MEIIKHLWTRKNDSFKFCIRMYGGGEESCRGRGNQVEESKLPMAPKATAKNKTPSRDPNGMFSGMVVFLVENGVQSRRLQVAHRLFSEMH